eukprot:2168252-Pyramimonas_sp.AAC.1
MGDSVALEKHKRLLSRHCPQCPPSMETLDQQMGEFRSVLAGAAAPDVRERLQGQYETLLGQSQSLLPKSVPRSSPSQAEPTVMQVDEADLADACAQVSGMEASQKRELLDALRNASKKP